QHLLSNRLSTTELSIKERMSYQRSKKFPRILQGFRCRTWPAGVPFYGCLCPQGSTLQRLGAGRPPGACAALSAAYGLILERFLLAVKRNVFIKLINILDQ